jgi:hypothetical protein
VLRLRADLPRGGACARKRQELLWRSRARWPCEAGQGRLWHGLAPRRRHMTTVSVAGRLGRGRFSRRHGMGSTVSAQKVLNYWRVTGSSIVKRCVHTSQLRRIGLCWKIHYDQRCTCIARFARPYYLRGLTLLSWDLPEHISGLTRRWFGCGRKSGPRTGEVMPGRRAGLDPVGKVVTATRATQVTGLRPGWLTFSRGRQQLHGDPLAPRCGDGAPARPDLRLLWNADPSVTSM